MAIGYELWFLPESLEFGESTSGGMVAPLPPETVFFKAVYVGEDSSVATALDQARHRLATPDFHGREYLHLLRPTSTSDGVPFRSTLIYRAAGSTEVGLLADLRIPPAYRPGAARVRAIRYHAVRVGSSCAWEADFTLGRQPYFLTGVSGAAELWRLARLEVDALDRQVLTLAPVRVPHGIAIPDFKPVTDPALGEHMAAHFDAFQRAVAANAHLDVIDRAYNLAEGVLAYALGQAARSVPPTLHGRITEARKLLAIKEWREAFPLSGYGLSLAEKIRHLHRQSHSDQAVERRRTVRPEVGMGVVSDLSELLVEAGLARY